MVSQAKLKDRRRPRRETFLRLIRQQQGIQLNLAVARSVLSPALIVVLDEPNAALDPMSEAAFYRVYEELLASKTTLFISHRLGAVKSADSILVLHDRHLIAMGSHDVLMRTCDCYREMFETQRGLYYGTKAS